MSAWVWAAWCTEKPALLSVSISAFLGLYLWKALCSLVLLLNCLSNLEIHNCLYYSKWLSGPQELRMWRKTAFVQLSFGVLSIQWWITFFSKSRTWLCQDWQREWEGTIDFVLKPHAELTFSWRASPLQHKMKCDQMQRNTSLPWAFQESTIDASWCLCFLWPFEHLDLSLQGESLHNQ